MHVLKVHRLTGCEMSVMSRTTKSVEPLSETRASWAPMGTVDEQVKTTGLGVVGAGVTAIGETNGLGFAPTPGETSGFAYGEGFVATGVVLGPARATGDALPHAVIASMASTSAVVLTVR
jgi:hypothetical protein